MIFYKDALFISALLLALCSFHLILTEDSSNEISNHENGNKFELSKPSSGSRELLETPQDSIESDQDTQIETEIEPKPSVLVPTDEWQTIEPGQSIPRGCHVRINFETGKKEAKWAEERNTHKFQLAPNTTESSQPIISLFDEIAKSEFKSTADNENLNETLNTLTAMGSTVNDTYILLCLDELEQLLSDGDLAQYVTSTEHFSYLISLLSSANLDVTSATCLVIGSMWQNNQVTQLIALERNALPTLISLFRDYRISQVDPSPVLFAISTLLRGLPKGMGMQYFNELDLAHVLTELVTNVSNSHKVVIKSLRFTTFLLDEYEAKVSDDLHLVFKRDAMVENLDRAGYCLALKGITEEDFPPDVAFEIKRLIVRACVVH